MCKGPTVGTEHPVRFLSLQAHVLGNKTPNPKAVFKEGGERHTHTLVTLPSLPAEWSQAKFPPSKQGLSTALWLRSSRCELKGLKGARPCVLSPSIYLCKTNPGVANFLPGTRLSLSTQRTHVSIQVCVWMWVRHRVVFSF